MIRLIELYDRLARLGAYQTSNLLYKVSKFEHLVKKGVIFGYRPIRKLLPFGGASGARTQARSVMSRMR